MRSSGVELLCLRGLVGDVVRDDVGGGCVEAERGAHGRELRLPGAHAVGVVQVHLSQVQRKKEKREGEREESAHDSLHWLTSDERKRTAAMRPCS